MGIGLLSMPFAMRQGGWLGMGALAVATAVFCLSGKLIVRNFDKLPPDASHTYPALGAHASAVTGCLPKEPGFASANGCIACLQTM